MLLSCADVAINNFFYELIIRVLNRAVEFQGSLCVEPGGKIKINWP